MKRTKLNLFETGLFETVFPYLEGHVFHVTKLANLNNIFQCDEIRVNGDGKFQTTFGSTGNSYFRTRGCISLFDYRSIDPELFEKHAYKCTPTQAASPESGIAVLIISKDIHSNLMTWRLWQEEKAYSQMVLPYFETGHPGPIALCHITEVIEITVNEDPNSFRALFRRSNDAGQP